MSIQSRRLTKNNPLKRISTLYYIHKTKKTFIINQIWLYHKRPLANEKLGMHTF